MLALFDDRPRYGIISYHGEVASVPAAQKFSHNLAKLWFQVLPFYG